MFGSQISQIFLHLLKTSKFRVSVTYSPKLYFINFIVFTYLIKIFYFLVLGQFENFHFEVHGQGYTSFTLK